MRLLCTEELPDGKYEMKEFGEENTPDYAILSHTWDDKELTLQDVEAGCLSNKKGYEKVRKCCATARANGFDYVWIDTVCIDKTSSAELSEAINSMYRWYEEADTCYSYLADVPSKATISCSRWLTRGWTLQELIAPSHIIFLDEQWNELGTKASLREEISRCTGIPIDILLGQDLETASIAQRMSWASKRKTSRLEDRAYCLMGIFRINMPLLYGEGERAFIRLQEEIMKVSDDYTIFAWRSDSQMHGSLLATSPDAFADSVGIITSSKFSIAANSLLTVTNKGIQLELPYLGVGSCGLGLAVLPCTERGKEYLLIAIYLRDVSLTLKYFERVKCETFEPINLTVFQPSQYPSRRISVRQQRLTHIRRRKGHRKPGNDVVGRPSSEFVLHETPDATPKFELFGQNMNFVDKSVSNSPSSISLQLEGYLRTHTQILVDRGFEKSLVDGVRQRLARPMADGVKRQSLIQSLLSWAALLGHAHIVWLVFARRDINPVNGQDASGWTPLSYAAGEGHKDVAWLLLTRSDVDIHSRDSGERTPLSYAAQGGHAEIINMILAQGGIQKDPGDAEKRTPLSYAAAGGHEAALKSFLGRSDMELETVDCYSDTPLWLAVRNGHVVVAELLIEQGADLERQNKSEMTPLLWAVIQRDNSMAQSLMEKGANIHAVSDDGKTALIYAVKDRNSFLVKLLLEKGANIDVADSSGRTALWSAVESKEISVVQLLLGNANVDATDRGGRTSLTLAAENGSDSIAQLLLEKGASIDADDKYGQTALFYAASQGHHSTVEMLLQKGATIDRMDRYGRTALSFAAMNSKPSVVQVLLDHGADIEAPYDDKSGQTLLQLANISRHRQQPAYLLILQKARKDGVLSKGLSFGGWRHRSEPH